MQHREWCGEPHGHESPIDVWRARDQSRVNPGPGKPAAQRSEGLSAPRQTDAPARHAVQGERHGAIRHRRPHAGHADRKRRALTRVRRQGEDLRCGARQGAAGRAARGAARGYTVAGDGGLGRWNREWCCGRRRHLLAGGGRPARAPNHMGRRTQRHARRYPREARITRKPGRCQRAQRRRRRRGARRCRQEDRRGVCRAVPPSCDDGADELHGARTRRRV